MQCLVILGANGFLGGAIVSLPQLPFRVKAVVRKKQAYANSYQDIIWYEADLLEPHALDTILEENDIVLNLAYIDSSDFTNNLLMVQNITASCLRNGVKRLVHCSTAVVVGSAKSSLIDELTPCIPLTLYEQSKFALEQCVLAAVSSNLEVVILRPTAIIGENGKNLIKLADALINGNSVVNYFRACIFSKRKMHLVPLNNVIAALLHLANHHSMQNGQIYIISSDDDAENNFFAIETILRKVLGLGSRKIPVLFFPLKLLSLLLKLKGRSEIDVTRIYESKKLLATNFFKVESIHDAVTNWAEYFSNKSVKKCIKDVTN